MNFLDEIDFKITDDSSIGLYSKKAEDIFHSKTGALKEAYDKFVNPALNLIKEKDSLNVLDICFGIGCNTKALLYKFPNKSFTIDALEFNKKFVIMSPFIFDSINDDELKYFLLKQINPDTADLKELFYQIDLRRIEQFFTASIINFKPDKNCLLYKYIISFFKHTFLHNIYYGYIAKSMKQGLKVNKY